MGRRLLRKKDVVKNDVRDTFQEFSDKLFGVLEHALMEYFFIYDSLIQNITKTMKIGRVAYSNMTDLVFII